MEEEKVLKDFPKELTRIDTPEYSGRPVMTLTDASKKGASEQAVPIFFGPTPWRLNINIDTEADREDARNWIIYRVPNKLRETRPEAYTPQMVSIGPFHHLTLNLEAMEHYKAMERYNAMEHYKAKYMDEFLRRSFCSHIKKEDLIHEFRKDDNELVRRINCSYKEESFKPEILTDRMIPMILQDACFIFELFLRNHETLPHDKEDDEKKKQREEKVKRYSGDYILRSPWVMAAIKQDLILLENQLPIFVLTQLFDRIFKHSSIDMDAIPDYLRELNKNGRQIRDFLILITCEFFIDFYKFGKPCTEENSKNKSHPFGYSEKDKEHWMSEMKDIIHFTDLIRKFMYDKKDESKSSYDLTLCLHSAKQLDNAGVRFGSPKDATYLARIKILPDVKDDDKCCWWNGRNRCWWNGRGCCWINCLELKIPQLKVQDNTECIFRNVMALEQFVYPMEPRICNYIFLLDQLIDTVEDVDLLVDKRIIKNFLGSNEAVVALVNKLCNQMVTPFFYYSDICNKLNDYHSVKLNIARSTLKRVYFKDIWTGSSTVVGLVFLVFSLFSTYSTIKSLFFV